MKYSFSVIFTFILQASLFSQGFERLLPMPSTNTSLSYNSYDFYPSLGGIITANNSQSPSDTVKMYAFDSIGNIRWVKSYRPMPEGLDISKFSTAILDNGHYIVAGSAMNNGTGSYTGAYTCIIRELDSVGNTLNTRLTPLNIFWSKESIEVYPLRNGSSQYYLTSRSDSTIYTSTPYQLESTLRFEKVSTGGIVNWTKSYVCTDTILVDPTMIYRSCVTKEGGLASCYKAPCVVSGSLGVLEKMDSSGNTIFIKDLQPIMNFAPDSFSITDVISCRDSSIIVIASRNFVFPSVRSYLLRFDVLGNLIDSMSTSVAISTAFEKLNGDMMVNYYVYIPSTGTFSVTGMIQYDYSLNYLNTFPLPFLENFYARIKMIPNNIGGAFFGFTRWSLTTMTKHLRIVNVDSSLNSYQNRICGNVNMDVNSNCVVDGMDYYLKDRMVIATDTVTNIPYYAFTNASGLYTASVPSGQFDVTQIANANAGVECPLVYNLSVAGSTTFSGIDFNDTLPGSMNDLSSTLYSDPIVPGFESTLSVIYSNDGAITQNAELQVVIDPFLNFVSSSIVPTSTSGDTLFYSLIAFPPDSANIIDIVVSADSTLVLGTAYSFKSFIFNTTIDFDPTNNNDTLNGLVIGSFDPNDKSINQPYFINGTEELTYKIRFQNTGTYFARKVVLTDSLSSYLDYSTLKFIDGSAPYSASLRTDGTLIISFDDIFLPDSNTNEPGSHGYFVYSIKPKSSFAIGQIIKNRAKIYFDYNAPIITNTTFNKKGSPVASIQEIEKNLFRLFPNPSDDVINIYFGKDTNVILTLYDVLGKIIFSTRSKGLTASLSVSVLDNGVYFIKVENEKGQTGVEKFVVSH